MEAAPHAVITIQGKVLTPNPPTALTTATAMHTIFLEWVNPADPDIDMVEVWRNTTDTLATATKIADVKGNHYSDNLGAPGITRYYWVRVQNKSGVYSGFNASAGVVATSGAVEATDIADFAITATKLFVNTIVLSGDSWTDHSPSAAYIAWNAHTIVYGGVAYPISAGSTNRAYLYWTVGATTYTGSATHPTSGFTIAVNTAGVHTLVWNSSANMVIGTAFIADLAVTNAKIADLNADKINAGTLNASIVTVSNLDAGNISTGTLTGRVVQTAASGQRVVVDSSDNQLKFYDSSGNLTGVIGGGTAIIYFKDYSGSTSAMAIHVDTSGICYSARRNGTGQAIIVNNGATTNITLYSEGVIDAASAYKVKGNQVVGARGTLVNDASGGATVDAEARTAINTLLARCRAHGLIAT